MPNPLQCQSDVITIIDRHHHHVIEPVSEMFIAAGATPKYGNLRQYLRSWIWRKLRQTIYGYLFIVFGCAFGILYGLLVRCNPNKLKENERSEQVNYQSFFIHIDFLQSTSVSTPGIKQCTCRVDFSMWTYRFGTGFQEYFLLINDLSWAEKLDEAFTNCQERSFPVANVVISILTSNI